MKRLRQHLFRGFVFCAGLIVSAMAVAAQFEQAWDILEGAEEYEYQLGTHADFTDEHLSKRGKTRETKISLSVEVGVYFFRLRALGANSQSGTWTPAIQILVRDEKIRIEKPEDNARIPLLGANTEVPIHWSDLGKEVDDYALKLEGPGNKSVFLQSPLNQVDVPNLSPGSWKIQVQGRKKGNPIFTSPKINIELLSSDNFSPRILVPVDGERIPEFAEFDLKWFRRLPGSKSEIALVKADRPGFPIVWRRNFNNTQAVELDGLAKGRYQITIKDFETEERESAETTITVNVIDNPRDVQPENIGVTGRLMGGSFVGYRSFSTPSLQENIARSPLVGRGQFESRATWKWPSGWGLETQIGSGYGDFKFQGGAAKFTELKAQSPDGLEQTLDQVSLYPYRFPTEGFARIGVLHRWPIRNQRFDLWLKGMLHYRFLRGPAFDFQSVVNTSTNVTTYDPIFSLTNYGQIGVAIAAEVRWRIKSWTELSLEATLPIPLIAEQGISTESGHIRLGSGKFSEFYMPELRLEIFLRRKISREFRLLVGGVSQMGFVSVREKAQRGAFTTTLPSGRTRSAEFSLSPRVGVDWEL